MILKGWMQFYRHKQDIQVSQVPLLKNLEIYQNTLEFESAQPSLSFC